MGSVGWRRESRLQLKIANNGVAVAEETRESNEGETKYRRISAVKETYHCDVD